MPTFGDCKRETFWVSVTQRATMAGPEDPENFGNSCVQRMLSIEDKWVLFEI